MNSPASSIKKLVQGFARHIKELKAPDYKESQVRKHYIDQFWKLLGWDVDNDEQRAPQDVDVLIEPSTDSAISTADYAATRQLDCIHSTYLNSRKQAL